MTSGNRSIGLETCRQLADRAFDVVLGSRDPDKGRRAVEAIGSTAGRVLPFQLDVADEGSVRRLADDVASELGGVDVVVNNAAILYDTWARGVDADLGEVHEAMEVNLFGAWRVAEAFIPLLRRSDHGRIVNVSSQAGSLASMSGGAPAYSISKAALNGLTRVLAAELRSDGILVNSICPGWVATDMGGPGGRPVEEGAASVVWGALLPDDGPTGGFFRDGRPLPW